MTVNGLWFVNLKNHATRQDKQRGATYPLRGTRHSVERSPRARVQREHTQYLGAVPPRAGGTCGRGWEVAHAVLVLYRALLPVSDSGMQAQLYVPGDGKDEVTKDNESFRIPNNTLRMEYHALMARFAVALR